MVSAGIVNEDPRSDRKLTRKAIERNAFGMERRGVCTIVFKGVDLDLDSLVVAFLYPLWNESDDWYFTWIFDFSV